ncbi:ABC-2 type transport system permease protein [Micromonospora phaseoli]|uniref:ABC-2 type transport system permease protein n=1 Tax=Micromonospora phaseoli TaxID=1144548 RepID=A0A1H6VN25_9ACTN|nr:ABC transporter permease [Micromonospora phaseoli]PZV93584.1 ABC-2 type transport system permease protein [Micromonospora phaseoli]GIJ80215.1 exporter of polyketide antibiotics [Micromonospora phaseoli]SEJ03137.1 ABC-2 type transport system permease protein [Micromonospora phaseoli]
MTTATASRSVPALARRASAVTGTGTLLRFMLRRDRIRFPAWTLGLTLLMTYFATALDTIVQSPADLAGMTAFTGSPAGALFGGRGFGFDELTLERFLAGQYGLYVAVGAALMGLLTVVRHTRAEERSGRAELVRANVVGRYAQLTAALALAATMALLVALLIGGLLISRGYDPGGSLLFGASVGAVALAFAGVAAVTAQLSEYPRAASGMAGAALGAAFVLRGLGDMAAVQGSGPSWLSWLSPIGWSQQTAPYVHDRWWPLAVSLAFTAAATAIGFALSARRDFGAGLVPPRPGSPRAAAWLASPFALAFRLHRASLIGWSASLLVAGLAYGSFTQPMLDGFENAPEDLVAIIGGADNLLAGFLGMLGLTMALTVGVYAVLAVQSLRAEEAEGRAESVLATAVSRRAWLGSHVAVAALGVPWLLLVAGLGMGIGAAVSTGDAGLLGDLVLGHLAHTPAVWLVLAAAALLYAAAPRALPVVWVVLGYGLIAGYFAPILEIPEGALRLSPFEHVGEYPLEEVSVVAVVVLAVLAGGLVQAAVTVFRRRDLAGGA